MVEMGTLIPKGARADAPNKHARAVVRGWPSFLSVPLYSEAREAITRATVFKRARATAR